MMDKFVKIMYNIKRCGDLIEIFSHFKLLEKICYNICLFDICKIYQVKTLEI